MKIFLKIDTTVNTPLYLQVYQRFHEGIYNGQLQAFQRVPSIRSLASELNVARGTIELAYQLLISEGLLIAKGAKGTFIAQSVKNIQENQLNNNSHINSLPLEIKDKAQDDNQYYSVVEPPKNIIPFKLGIPALDAFPIKLWSRLSANVLREANITQLSYPDPQGLLSLREDLARYLVMSRGINCSPDQIFISAGYCTSLTLIMQSLFKVGDIGWFEEPGYHIARTYLQHIGIQLVPIEIDNNGIMVKQGEQLAPKAKFALVTPTHQSPTNVSLSLERRVELLDWADKNQSWIIEDDYDGEFRYQGRPLPALKSLDKHERVIYCGTMSKALFPALRLTYIVVPATQIQRFYSVANIISNQRSIWQQEITHRFIRDGHFARHLRKMRNLYRQRRLYLIDAITKNLSDVFDIQMQSGGMHIIVKIINGLSSKKFAEQAHKIGFGLESIDEWSMNKSNKQILILGFTNIKNEIMANEYCEKLKIISLKLLTNSLI